MKVDSRTDLGKWVGLCKLDSTNVARNIRPCSCVVLKKWPEQADLQGAVQIIKSQMATA